MAGRLIMCATPIGNLGDAPPRLGEVIAEATVVYAEDTRRARVLLDHLGASAPLRSFFVGNEHRRVAELSERLLADETVVLLTDAGTPAISDPGVSAVRAAVEVGATVTGVPGPSAVTFALAVSGASADRFVFEGFLPRSGRERAQRISSIAADERTTVLFCAPSRLVADLRDLAATMPDRACVVGRELTKFHEELWRGLLADAEAHWAQHKVRGEVTLVVFGGPPAQPDAGEAVRLARDAIAAGERPSSAVRRIAEETGVSRRVLYGVVIEDDSLPEIDD